MIRKRRQKSGGRLRYGVRIERGGKPEWVGTFDTLAEAREAQRDAQSKRTTTSSMAADKWAEEWLENYKADHKESSYLTAAAALSKFKQDFKGITLTEIAKHPAQRWARENQHRVATVVNCLNAAIDADLLERNPFAGMSRKGKGRKHVQPLTVAEVDALAQAAADVHGDYGPTMRAFVLVLAYTGIRQGEARALDWDDIDFERRRIRVARRIYKGTVALPKSNAERECVLLPPARDALLTLDGPREGRIFNAKRGGAISESMLTGYWAPIAARVFGGRRVTPHELKHFAGHYLYVTRGLPDRVVAVQLGHNDGGQLVRTLYGHGDVGALEEIDADAEKVVPLPSVAISEAPRATPVPQKAASGTS